MGPLGKYTLVFITVSIGKPSAISLNSSPFSLSPTHMGFLALSPFEIYFSAPVSLRKVNYICF